MVTSSPSTSLDFAGLTGLKAGARDKTPEAIREVAEQFEALFVQMMMKSMRDASLGDGLFNSQQMRTYQEMFDREAALSLAKGNGIGLADVIARQLGGERGEAPEPVVGHAPRAGELPPLPVTAAAPAAAATALHAPRVPDSAWPVAGGANVPDVGEAAAPAAAPVAVPETSAAEPAGYDDPKSFVAAVWDDADRAARQLGTRPEVLVAQAALETGWGRAVARRDDGSSSHNLFNIKARGDWGGDRVRVSTLEFVDGVAERRTEPFRAYDSARESFNDYVALIAGSGRYAGARAAGGDAKAYVEALADGGYATDPQYANKILSILGGDTLRDAIEGLKNSGSRTL